MTGLWILLTAVLVYLAFRVWYDNGRGPLRREEIDTYLERIEGSGLSDTRDLNSMRRFSRKTVLSFAPFDPLSGACTRRAREVFR